MEATTALTHSRKQNEMQQLLSVEQHKKLIQVQSQSHRLHGLFDDILLQHAACSSEASDWRLGNNSLNERRFIGPDTTQTSAIGPQEALCSGSSKTDTSGISNVTGPSFILRACSASDEINERSDPASIPRSFLFQEPKCYRCAVSSGDLAKTNVDDSADKMTGRASGNARGSAIISDSHEAMPDRSANTSRNHRLSSFEKLPRELREYIYRYLCQDSIFVRRTAGLAPSILRGHRIFSLGFANRMFYKDFFSFFLGQQTFHVPIDQVGAFVDCFWGKQSQSHSANGHIILTQPTCSLINPSRAAEFQLDITALLRLALDPTTNFTVGTAAWARFSGTVNHLRTKLQGFKDSMLNPKFRQILWNALSPNPEDPSSARLRRVLLVVRDATSRLEHPWKCQEMGIAFVCGRMPDHIPELDEWDNLRYSLSCAGLRFWSFPLGQHTLGVEETLAAVTTDSNLDGSFLGLAEVQGEFMLL